MSPLGQLLRHHRKTRGISQEDLALAAEISPRHLSFIENGRTLPSRDVVLGLANALDAGPKALGSFLEAAGYVAPYPELDHGSAEAKKLLSQVTQIVDVLGEPACAHDRYGTLLHVNGMLLRLLAHVTGAADTAARDGAVPRSGPVGPTGLVKAGAGGYDLLVALRPHIVNAEEVIGFYRARLFRQMVRGDGSSRDPGLEQLRARMCGSEAGESTAPDPAVVVHLRLGESILSFRLVTMTLGVPQDIVCRNYRLALLLPADASTREHLLRITG